MTVDCQTRILKKPKKIEDLDFPIKKALSDPLGHLRILDFFLLSGKDNAVTRLRPMAVRGRVVSIRGTQVDKIEWIKDLVKAEQAMEESGVIDVTAGFDPGKHLSEATFDFMRDLKAAFVESAAAFNQLKGSTLGTVKIYGISNTATDFMLFRNGYKLIFTVLGPGILSIRFNTIGNQFFPQPQAEGSPSQATENGDTLKASWGAFGELNWTYDGKPINLDYLIRYYMTRFIRESTK